MIGNGTTTAPTSEYVNRGPVPVRPGLHPEDMKRAAGNGAILGNQDRCQSLNSTVAAPSDARLSALEQRVETQLQISAEIARIVISLRTELLSEGEPANDRGEDPVPHGMVNILHYQIDRLEITLQQIARNVLALNALR